MAYKLTEEDIKNFNLQGSTAGDIATDADLEAMGKLTAEQIETAPAVTPSQTTLDYTEARTQGVEPEYAPQSGGFPATASPSMGVGVDMASLLSQPVPQDPFENLSRSQRMMLGFSALQDAGMALQGKEGGAFEATMSGFRERADMERKRQAALARQQMLGQLTGGTAGGSREALLAAAAQGLIDGPTLQAMLGEIDRREKKTLGDQGKGFSAANQLDTMREIARRVEEDPTMTTGLLGMVLRNIPMSKAGQTQALIDSLRSTLALDTLKELKATEATMGALNKEELNVLLDDVTKLDLALGADAVNASLDKIEGKYVGIVRQLYAGASEEDLPMLDEMFGGRPTFLTASAPKPTFRSATVGEVVLDEDGVSYEYQGGDRNDASSWKRVQ